MTMQDLGIQVAVLRSRAAIQWAVSSENPVADEADVGPVVAVSRSSQHRWTGIGSGRTACDEELKVRLPF